MISMRYVSQQHCTYFTHVSLFLHVAVLKCFVLFLGTCTYLTHSVMVFVELILHLSDLVNVLHIIFKMHIIAILSRSTFPVTDEIIDHFNLPHSNITE